MQRYGGAIDHILRLPLSIGAALIRECYAQKQEEMLLDMYKHLLPHMERKLTFEEYKAKCFHKEYECTADLDDVLKMAAMIDEKVKAGEVINGRI